MLIYGVYSVLTEESQDLLEEFFEGAPMELKFPLLYELGTQRTKDIKLRHPSIVYELVPRELAVRYNPRTGGTSLFWDLNSVGFEAATRFQELGTVLVEDKDENQSVYNSIVLCPDFSSNNRRIRGWLNSKEDALDGMISRGEPLILEFEGEMVVEFEVPDISVYRG